MPLNDGKIRQIIYEQRNVVEERYAGYRDQIVTLIGKILDDERRHRVSRMNIQKRINDKFADAAWSLAKKRSSKAELKNRDS